MTILDHIGHPRILVVGDLILDRYTFGNAERVSPEAPVVVLRVDGKEVRLGGAASVAMLLRGLEAEVTLAGVIGDDSEGRTLLKLLDDEQIDRSMVLVDETRPTTTKERIIGRAANRHSHQIVRVDHETREPLSPLLEESLKAALARYPLGTLPNLPASVAEAASVSKRQFLSSPPAETHYVRIGARPPIANELHFRFDAILISDYAKGVCTPGLLRYVIDVARDFDVPVIVDPARIGDYDHYAGATLLKPNRTEAELATGLNIESPEHAFAAAAKLCETRNFESVLVTLDRDGMVLVGKHKVAGTLRVPSSALESPAQHPGTHAPGSPADALHLPAEPREIYDITGAGDMVLATLGLCIGSGVPLQESAQIANIAAGLEVERLGVAPVTRQELVRALNILPLPLGEARGDAVAAPPSGAPSVHPFDSSAISTPATSSPKITTLPALLPVLRDYRRCGQTIVVTNGCFDLLHLGHVATLEQAATLGDVLIVAVNSDAGVRRLKGSGRPVISEHHRAAMLAAMGCVDHVLIFDEPTPHALLQQIRPEILAKGGTTPEITGRELIESYGGRSVRLGSVQGISTTSLIATLAATGLRSTGASFSLLAGGSSDGADGEVSDSQSADESFRTECKAQNMQS
jgi:D-beta-D-heptose 7-phosphate kinase/D-beta-D-heptose 1-phosphate adenosyltransferase